MKIFKRLTASAIRSCIYSRLRTFPPTESQAKWYGALFKKYPSLFPRGGYRVWATVNTHGMQMKLGVIDHIERHLLTEQVWDRAIEEIIRGFVEPGDTAIDLGANIGYFTLVLADAVGPNGRVFSFEPSPRVLSRLAQHVDINQLMQVTVLSVGAGESWDSLQIVHATPSNTGGSSIQTPSSGQRADQILVCPIGEILAKIYCEPAFIKIDVEGYDLFALRGLKPLLKYRPSIVCELTPELLSRNGLQTKDLLQFLWDQQYEVYAFDANRELRLQYINHVAQLLDQQVDVLATSFTPSEIQERLGQVLEKRNKAQVEAGS